MSRDVKYQIFVSSTFEDLQDERRRLMEQILNLGHIPVGMELFKAANEQQWSYIKKRIVSCDYYLLIVAERYGSVDENGVSYTQKEYEFAVSSGIPVAAFLLSNEGRTNRKAKLVEHSRRAEIDAFRQLCSANRMVNFWHESADLALTATNALLDLIREEPRQGWVRADQSDEAALRELAKLAEEKRSLEERLSLIEHAPLRAPADISYHIEKLSALNVTSFINDNERTYIHSFKPVDLIQLYIKLSRSLAAGVSEIAAQKIISEICKVKLSAISVKITFSKRILNEFAAFGLIDISYTATNLTSPRRMCYLTEYGRKVLMYAESRQEDDWNEESQESTE